MAGEFKLVQKRHRRAMRIFQQEQTVRSQEVLQRAQALVDEFAEENRAQLGAAMTRATPPHITATASPQLLDASEWPPLPSQRPQRRRHLVPRLHGTRGSMQARRTAVTTRTAATAAPPSDASHLQVNLL